MPRFLIFIFLSFLAGYPLFAQGLTTHQMALEAIDLATNLHYEEAAEIFEEIILREPENPRGYFLRSAVYFWMFSEDVKNTDIGDKFRDLSYEAVEIAEAKLDKDENDIDAMFYLGGAYGSLGRYYTMNQSYLNAYWYGKKGVNYLEDVIELDSTYYDAYLGLGIYHYLADVLPRFIKILSFILGMTGDKEVGIRELGLAAEKGIYTKTEAMFFLAAIYTYREREYEKAIDIFNQLLDRYPDNPGALLSLGRCYSNMGECDLAIAAYEKILQNKERQSRLPRGSVHYQLGDVYYKKNDFSRSRDHYLLAIASDTAKVGKKRWITPWAHYKVSHCYEILGNKERAMYHLEQVSEEDNERAYERAQERIDKYLHEIDILLIKAENMEGCNQFDQSLILLDQITLEYKDQKDPYIEEKLFEVDFRRAEIYFQQENFNLAIEQFQKFLAVDDVKDESLKYWSHYYLGNCYKVLGEYKKAEESYDAAEDSDSDRLLENIEDERKDLPEN